MKKNKAVSTFILIVVLVENGIFAWFQLVCDQPTDKRTDTPSYRDARTLLQIGK